MLSTENFRFWFLYIVYWIYVIRLCFAVSFVLCGHRWKHFLKFIIIFQKLTRNKMIFLCVCVRAWKSIEISNNFHLISRNWTRFSCWKWQNYLFFFLCILYFGRKNCSRVNLNWDLLLVHPNESYLHRVRPWRQSGWKHSAVWSQPQPLRALSSMIYFLIQKCKSFVAFWKLIE